MEQIAKEIESGKGEGFDPSTEALLEADPDAAEGALAPRFNALVRKEACAEVARAARG